MAQGRLRSRNLLGYGHAGYEIRRAVPGPGLLLDDAGDADHPVMGIGGYGLRGLWRVRSQSSVASRPLPKSRVLGRLLVAGAAIVTLLAVAPTVGTADPSGLVAAYGFEEGSGTTTADASGNGNTGTLVNATWTAAGKYGGCVVVQRHERAGRHPGRGVAASVDAG